MDYTKVLDEFGITIEMDLDRLLKQSAEEGRSYHPFIGDVYQTVEEFVMRKGSRLASCSTLLIYQGYKNFIDDRIIRVCSGMELYRHSILVHDDVADYEELRRGGKTIHKMLGENYDERFGNGAAIFAGNMLYALALETVLGSGFDDDRLQDVSGWLASDYRKVNESQILDVLFEYGMPSRKEWQVMASRRAVSLFRLAMLTGAILASAPERDRALLEGAAEHIGYAFDIQDDIIDTFATREQYGREPCGDLSKRKKPLHVVLAIEKDDRAVAAFRGRGELSPENIAGLKDLIRECGALDEAKAISREHAREAERLISMTGMNRDVKEFFASLLSYIQESLDWYA